MAQGRGLGACSSPHWGPGTPGSPQHPAGGTESVPLPLGLGAAPGPAPPTPETSPAGRRRAWSAGGEERAPGVCAWAAACPATREFGAWVLPAALPGSSVSDQRPDSRVQGTGRQVRLERSAQPAALCQAGCGVTAAAPAPGRLSAGACAESAGLAACSRHPPGAAGTWLRAGVGGVGISWNRAEIRVVQKWPVRGTARWLLVHSWRCAAITCVRVSPPA